MTLFPKRLLVACLACLALAGCETVLGQREPLAEAPVITPASPTGIGLETLPPPERAIDVAIYAFPDLTGQNKPSDNFAEYSRAVTQGGSAFAVDALRRAGGGKWFNVVERGGLQSLLQERQLIRATRTEFEGVNAKPLPPLRFAGLLVEGGILAYDANTVTGGLGARYLGVGLDTKYRRDMVTVAMRVVSVQSGQVLLSVTTTKTIYSVLVSGNIYKFVALDRILEAETGFSRNEPTQLAVREAIELAVYSLIIEGAERKLWKFKNGGSAAALIERYRGAPVVGAKAELADPVPPTQYSHLESPPAPASAAAAPASPPEAPLRAGDTPAR
ncbi:curli production assembly protein CsgG [Methylobacterium sp. Leaf104]|uniref:CsgG/HfaB family protein n=1 Tax=Methylobacterium TaxID=407 RepID=UPI0006F89AB9|nr:MULTISPECIES: CsgG/HfaB family protein [Methylobacterium]KQP29866.1 curli production assembly protein CsgG [Methylobacterium sp. Leaf104]MCI9882445.1 curli production assembly protein CsgG [Methylobacterium goesingense]